jgi:protoheme IX farnesyltransferase
VKSPAGPDAALNALTTSAEVARSAASANATVVDRVRDYASMTRPRIGGFVFYAALTGGLVAGGGQALERFSEFARAAEAAAWIALSAAGASVFNQVLEKQSDGWMRRTADRPLPTGRIGVRDALLFGTALEAAAIAGLALRFNLLAALLALATFASYVLLYTPLKRLSSLNTVVGAFPGAMPPLLGAVALAGSVQPWAWSLFALLFAWQFPHFMAIGWLNQEDYRRAGVRMLPALGVRGAAGLQAVGYSLACLVVSLVPFAQGRAGWVYGAAAAVLGLAYVAASIAFARRESDVSARLLLRCSLLHLPLVYSFVLLDPLVRASSLSLPG